MKRASKRAKTSPSTIDMRLGIDDNALENSNSNGSLLHSTFVPFQVDACQPENGSLHDEEDDIKSRPDTEEGGVSDDDDDSSFNVSHFADNDTWNEDSFSRQMNRSPKMLTRAQTLQVDYDFFEMEDDLFELEEEATQNAIETGQEEDESESDEESEGAEDETLTPWEVLEREGEEAEAGYDDEEGSGEEWNEADGDDLDEEEDEEDDDEDEPQISDSELAALRETAPTFLQPEDVRRIRQAFRDHVQLLAELLMLSASANKQTLALECAGMLEKIIQVASKNTLTDCIFKGGSLDFIPNLVRLLNDYRVESQQSPLVPDQPNWKQPISARYERILLRHAESLHFSRDLYPDVRRQKVRDKPDEEKKTSKNWRNWNEHEIDLVVLGFNKFGGSARGVTQKISAHLLPSRDPHIITRIIYEATGKKRAEERFEPIRQWLQEFPNSRMSEDEERRLLHGVALQEVKTVDKINFDVISSQFLPHISGFMLKKRFEDILVRQSKANNAAAAAAASITIGSASPSPSVGRS